MVFTGRPVHRYSVVASFHQYPASNRCLSWYESVKVKATLRFSQDSFFPLRVSTAISSDMIGVSQSRVQTKRDITCASRLPSRLSFIAPILASVLLLPARSDKDERRTTPSSFQFNQWLASIMTYPEKRSSFFYRLASQFATCSSLRCSP